MTLQLGILLALLCAIASNLSFFFKHRGAREAPAVDVRHPWRTAKALYSSRWFSIGMVVGGGAWALHVAAISLVPLSVVQVVLSGGVVLIAVIVAAFGLIAVAVFRAIHQKSILTPWLALGLLPGIVGLWLCLG